MSDIEKSPLDRAKPAKENRAPSPRLIRAGEHLLAGEKSMKKALVKAGYAESTAQNPTMNNLTAPRAIQAALQVRVSETDSLRSLEADAIQALKDVITDPNEPGSTRSAASAATLKLIKELGVPEVEDGPELPHQYRAKVYKAILLGAALAQRYGTDKVLQRFMPRYEAAVAVVERMQPLQALGKGGPKRSQ